MISLEILSGPISLIHISPSQFLYNGTDKGSQEAIGLEKEFVRIGRKELLKMKEYTEKYFPILFPEDRELRKKQLRRIDELLGQDKELELALKSNVFRELGGRIWKRKYSEVDVE